MERIFMFPTQQNERMRKPGIDTVTSMGSFYDAGTHCTRCGIVSKVEALLHARAPFPSTERLPSSLAFCSRNAEFSSQTSLQPRQNSDADAFAREK